MCFQFGAWRKGSKTQSTLTATAPQTLLTSSAHGKGKAVRFDPETPDSVPSLTRLPARKGTPWQAECEGAAAQAVQFAGGVGEKDDEVDPVRKEVRKATPWHCGSDANAATASHIRFDTSSCTHEDARDGEVDPVRKQVRKATPWHCGSDANAAIASHVRFASSCTDEDAKGDVVDPVRKEVRKATPWHCGSDANAATASHIQFATSSLKDEDAKDNVVDPVRKEVRKATPWHCSSDVKAATASHIQFATSSCTDEDAITSGGGAKYTEEVRTPKVAQWPAPMQVDGDAEKPSRHICWSVSAEQAFQASQSVEVAKTDAARRPGRAATPFASSAEAVEGKEEEERHIQWCESDEEEEPEARRIDRKGTPWHSGAETPDCGEQADKHIEWSDSVEEPSARRPERVDTPWLSYTQNADCAKETAIQWSESVEDFSARQAFRKSTPWHAVDAQTMHTEDSERAQLEQEVSMHSVAEEVPQMGRARRLSVEINDEAAPKGLSLLTACWMCRSPPNVSTDELQV